MTDSESCNCDVGLWERVYREYLELPGLQLTLAQAARLCDASRETCAQVLESLVDAGFLRRVEDVYARADSARLCA